MTGIRSFKNKNKTVFCIMCVVLCYVSAGLVFAGDKQRGNYDSFGGYVGLQGTATGWFHLEKIQDRWWFIDPEGKAFISKGVVGVKMTDEKYRSHCLEKYKTEKAFAEESVRRLKAWGFNTVGSWSDKECEALMPFAPILQIGYRTRIDDPTAYTNLPDQKGVIIPDVYHPNFRTRVRNLLTIHGEKVRQQDPTYRPFADCISNALCIGYFIDNEVSLHGYWRYGKYIELNHLLYFLAWDPGIELYKYSHRQAVEFLLKKYGDMEKLKTVYDVGPIGTIQDMIEKPVKAKIIDMTIAERDKIEFWKDFLNRYFGTCVEEIKKIDPNHLILGCRFANYQSMNDILLETIAPFVDVISINLYSYPPAFSVLQNVNKITKKPVMISEFTFVSYDSGHSNTIGAGPRVDTQEERSALYHQWVKYSMGLKYFVGYHWFRWVDEPFAGRWDGENLNCGFVKQEITPDEPWDALAAAATKINTSIEEHIVQGWKLHDTILDPTAIRKKVVISGAAQYVDANYPLILLGGRKDQPNRFDPSVLFLFQIPVLPQTDVYRALCILKPNFFTSPWPLSCRRYTGVSADDVIGKFKNESTDATNELFISMSDNLRGGRYCVIDCTPLVTSKTKQGGGVIGIEVFIDDAQRANQFEKVEFYGVSSGVGSSPYCIILTR